MGKIGFILLVFVVIFSQCTGMKFIERTDKNLRISDTEDDRFRYLFLEAKRSKFSGDLHRAKYFFNKCIQINSSSDAAFFELSNIHFALQDIEKALEYAQHALRLDSGNKWYYFQLATLYRNNNQDQKAISVYEALVHRFPDEIDFQITLAVLLIDSGKNTEALLLLEKVEAITGLNRMVSLTRHNAYLNNKDYEKAYLEIQKLITHFPTDIEYLGVLAELYIRLGLDKQVIETYNRILEIEPESGITHFSIAEYLVSRGWYEQAFPHFAFAFRDKSIRPIDKVRAISGLYQDSLVLCKFEIKIYQLIDLVILDNSDNPQVIMVAADFFIKTRNFERAVTELKSLVRLLPENYAVTEQLVLILFYQERYNELVEFASIVTSRFPDEELLNYFLAASLFSLERYEEVISVVESFDFLGLKEKEQKINFMLLLADSYNKLLKYEDSDRYFAEVLKLEPENLIALNNWAYYLSLRGENLMEAERMSRFTIDREPENSTFLDTYAWVLFKLSRYELALTYIEKAIKFKEEYNAEIFDHYGDILLKNGNPEKAVEMWRKAFELENDRIELIEKIRYNETKF